MWNFEVQRLKQYILVNNTIIIFIQNLKILNSTPFLHSTSSIYSDIPPSNQDLLKKQIPVYINLFPRIVSHDM